MTNLIRRTLLCMTLILSCLGSGWAASDQTHSIDQKISQLSLPTIEVLAYHHRPNAEGAIGRNRKAYFHARFQLGLHYLAYLAIRKQDTDALERFLSALEYAFQKQQEDGSFALNVPASLNAGNRPSEAELASGVAFFMASAGPGMWLLQQSDWFLQSSQTQNWRPRLRAIKQRLPLTLEHLLARRCDLERADRRAPNRLLFNATAFLTLGKLLDDRRALEQAQHFQNLALEQQHSDGYFIEGGGYDSSYNGVAAALALRMSLIEHDPALQAAAQDAVNWQASRVSDVGEIRTKGNTRVRPNGEKFLGRRKDVDVFHSLEAFLLSPLFGDDDEHRVLAERIYRYYSQRK